MTLGFGQKVGQVVQMAYTVKDIHAAVAWWLPPSGAAKIQSGPLVEP